MYLHKKPLVEDLIVDAKEHKILKKFKKTLEMRHNVLICMPNTKSLDSDIIFVSVQGELSNRDEVKKFLEKMSNPSNVESQDNGSDDDVVILSDNESESSRDIDVIDLSDEETSESVENFRNNEPLSVIDSPSCSTNIQIKTLSDEDTSESVKKSILEHSHEPVCIIDSPCSTNIHSETFSDEDTSESIKKTTLKDSDEPVCIIDNPSCSTNIQIKNFSDESTSESIKKSSLEDSHKPVCINDNSSCSTNIQIKNLFNEDTLESVKKSSLEVSHNNEPVCIIDDPSCSTEIQSKNLSNEKDSESFKKLTFDHSHNNEFICIIDSPSTSIQIKNSIGSQQLRGTKRKKPKKNKTNMVIRCNDTSSSSENKVANECDVTSTTDDNAVVSKKAKLSDSVLLIEEFAPSNMPVIDFIPLQSSHKPVNQRNEHKNLSSINANKANNDGIIVLDEIVPQPIRPLRPIVIDGSNVAMEHGKVTRTFSVKGIKLAIDYFVKRGHKQVTAFIPKFRRNQNPNRVVPTTDFDLLNELENRQQIVYTPSRRIDGRCIASYDDRFIVHLAATNGGVIVSNDNYRDLMNESESFKEAIQQRLLMYCFVGDIFMVPDDPLGRNGPKLNEFLSFC